MSYELITSGGFSDLNHLYNFEGYIDENQRGKLVFDLRAPISGANANILYNQLVDHGVEDASVTTSGNTLTVGFRKGFPWLAVIAAIILALAVLAILIIGWRLYRELFPEGLPTSVNVALVGALIVLGILAFNKLR